MEVNNRNVTLPSQYRVNENAAPIKAGDVCQIVIKESLGKGEALAVMKGQEATVQFKGPVPTNDRVLVEVISVNDKGQFVVNPVNPQAMTSPKPIDIVKDIMMKSGFDPASHPDLSEAVKLILSKGGSVSKESLVVLQQFLKNENGPLEQKLETIRAVQQKNIEWTSIHLRSVHTALHGKSLTTALSELMVAVDPPLTLHVNRAVLPNHPDIRTKYQSNLGEMVKAGFDPETHSDLRVVMEMLLSKGGTVSKASLAVLQQFLKNENGPFEQKLETIRTVQEKNSEWTSNHLRSVHTALHGKALTTALTEQVDVVDAPVTVQANKYRQTNLLDVQNKASLVEDKPQQDLKALLEKVRHQLKESRSPIDVAKAFLTILEKSTVDKSLIQQVTLDVNKALQIYGAGKDRIIQVLEKAAAIPGTNHAQMIVSLKAAIQKEPDMNHIIKLVESSKLSLSASMNQESSIKATIQNQSNRNPIIAPIQSNKANLPREMIQEISTTVQDAQKLQQIGASRLDQALNSLSLQLGQGKASAVRAENNSTTAFQSLVKDIPKEPSMEKVIAAVQKIVLENTNQTDIDFSPLQNALEKASRLNDQGRELAARKEIINALAQIEKDNPPLQQSRNHQILTEAEQYNINEVLQTLKLDSKNVMVTEITKKLSQLTIDFKKMKQEVTRNLDNVTKLLEPNKPISPAPIKQMLESTISKLDKAILKSDFMLYTDMETEKKMLNASSKLAEARNLLSKGDYPEANQIIKEVKGLVDKLVFKPSDVRVQHFVAEQSMKETFSPKMIPQQLEQMVRPHPEDEQGARQVFETIRRLGLTHETEAARSLILPTSEKQEEQHNLKSVLMKMLHTEDAQGKFTPQAEQALSNLTGQQLLNKQDSTGMQNMFLQLPLLLNKQVENVKIFVNSQKKGEKIDWENCSLYFVLETKKLGEVGILISATNRNLSVTFKNNQERFQEKLEPLVEISKERLNEIGYNVGAFQFKPFTTIEETSNTSSTVDKMNEDTPTFTEKGYDFSI